MERWQILVLFWVVVFGSIALFFADQLGVELDTLKLSGFGAITAYVLTADRRWGKSKDDDKPSHKKEDADER